MAMEQEKHFVVNLSDDGVLTFIIKAKDSEPTNPKLFYDGKDHAILVRNAESKVLLDYLNEELKPLLAAGTTVNVVEMRTPDLDEVVYSYDVEITRMANLPALSIDLVTPEDFEKEMESQIATLTPEEIALAEQSGDDDIVV